MKLNPYNYDTTKRPKVRKGGDFVYDSRLADKHIKHCKKCNRCWEVQIGFNNKNKYGRRDIEDFIAYYVNFPTYGKKKQQCHQCKKESK